MSISNFEINKSKFTLDLSFKEKYLKYKSKYLELKTQIGGSIPPSSLNSGFISSSPFLLNIPYNQIPVNGDVKDSIKVVNSGNNRSIGTFNVTPNMYVQELVSMIAETQRPHSVRVELFIDGKKLNPDTQFHLYDIHHIDTIYAQMYEVAVQQPPKPPVYRYKENESGIQRQRCIIPDLSKNRGPPIGKLEIIYRDVPGGPRRIPAIGERAEYKDTFKDARRGTIISDDGRELEMQCDDGTVICGHYSKFQLLVIALDEEAEIRERPSFKIQQLYASGKISQDELMSLFAKEFINDNSEKQASILIDDYVANRISKDNFLIRYRNTLIDYV